MGRQASPYNPVSRAGRGVKMPEHGCCRVLELKFPVEPNMFMKAQQVSTKSGIRTENVSFTNEAACDDGWRVEHEIARMKADPTMFMKTQLLSAKVGILTEFQVTQNKQLTRVPTGRAQNKKRF